MNKLIISSSNVNQLYFSKCVQLLLFHECFHCHSFQPVNCNIAGRMQSLQADIIRLTYWTLIYHM